MPFHFSTSPHTPHGNFWQSAHTVRPLGPKGAGLRRAGARLHQQRSLKGARDGRKGCVGWVGWMDGWSSAGDWARAGWLAGWGACLGWALANVWQAQAQARAAGDRSTEVVGDALYYCSRAEACVVRIQTAAADKGKKPIETLNTSMGELFKCPACHHDPSPSRPGQSLGIIIIHHHPCILSTSKWLCDSTLTKKGIHERTHTSHISRIRYGHRGRYRPAHIDVSGGNRASVPNGLRLLLVVSPRSHWHETTLSHPTRQPSIRIHSSL
ncbi:hypothetical protein DFH27DRAFT_203201 [Peziza echinospora]|nr:hypothetical protein DFH27DRAFT_203201 [Peziza echinospora]